MHQVRCLPMTPSQSNLKKFFVLSLKETPHQSFIVSFHINGERESCHPEFFTWPWQRLFSGCSCRYNRSGLLEMVGSDSARDVKQEPVLVPVSVAKCLLKSSYLMNEEHSRNVGSGRRLVTDRKPTDESHLQDSYKYLTGLCPVSGGLVVSCPKIEHGGGAGTGADR